MQHTPLHTESLRIVDRMITQLERLPNGTLFRYSLPSTGKASLHTLRKKWVAQLMESFFPTHFLHMLTRACLDANGVPTEEGIELYSWLLKNVYSNNVRKMYTVWLQLQKGGNSE